MVFVRVATWNLERGGRTRAARVAQAVEIRNLAADVLVLSEPGPSFEEGPGVVASPRQRKNGKTSESWIAIVGDAIEPASFEIPFERMAVAATARVNGVALLIYGSVLPWAAFRTHAPELGRDGESSHQAFLRLLQDQAADIEALRRCHPNHIVIWAGDFNQHVSGPNHGGSLAKREALVEALDNLALVAWNGAAAHANSGLCAIDLICGPRELDVREQGRIDPFRGGIRMTDHAGYWVEV